MSSSIVSPLQNAFNHIDFHQAAEASLNLSEAIHACGNISFYLNFIPLGFEGNPISIYLKLRNVASVSSVFFHVFHNIHEKKMTGNWNRQSQVLCLKLALSTATFYLVNRFATRFLESQMENSALFKNLQQQEKKVQKHEKEIIEQLFDEKIEAAAPELASEQLPSEPVGHREQIDQEEPLNESIITSIKISATAIAILCAAYKLNSCFSKINKELLTIYGRKNITEISTYHSKLAWRIWPSIYALKICHSIYQYFEKSQIFANKKNHLFSARNLLSFADEVQEQEKMQLLETLKERLQKIKDNELNLKNLKDSLENLQALQKALKENPAYCRKKQENLFQPCPITFDAYEENIVKGAFALLGWKLALTFESLMNIHRQQLTPPWEIKKLEGVSVSEEKSEALKIAKDFLESQIGLISESMPAIFEQIHTRFKDLIDFGGIKKFGNLRACRAIPFYLQQDPIFCQNICPITKKPIRFAIRAPKGLEGASFEIGMETNLYEEEAFFAKLEAKKLGKGQLKAILEKTHVCDTAQKKIEERLELYSQLILSQA